MNEEIEYAITEKGMGYILGAVEERNRWLKAVERVRCKGGSWYSAACDDVLLEMEREDA